MERSGVRFETFAHKGYKIAAQFFLVLLANFALLAGFFGIAATMRIAQEILCFLYAGFFYYPLSYN